MSAVYNEIEPFAVGWLESLIARGVIANGTVDHRSIVEVAPADVRGRAFHAFAGIGGWAEALRLAGCSADDPRIWSGSCPCPPFSVAGRGRGFADERHLWPEWFRLIRECRPAIVFGEQVASPLALAWLDAVFADLEGAGYACAAADLCAASVGAPHRRQRLWFVAYAHDARLEGLRRHVAVGSEPRWLRADADGHAAESREPDGLADADHDRLQEQRAARVHDHRAAGDDAARRGATVRVEHADGDGSGRDAGTDARSEGAELVGMRRVRDCAESRGATRGAWSDAEWVACRDGKARPIEPGTPPLVDGLSGGLVGMRGGRVGALKGYGNAIVPQVAAAFITAALDAIEGVGR